MLNQILQFHSNLLYDKMIKFLISVGLLFGLCPVIIEMKGEMPITLQSMMILFVSIGFGWRIGASAVLVYIIAGMCGLPVFAGYRSGVEVVLGPYGGFFFGFVAASLICGYLSELSAFSKTLPAIMNWFVGHSIIILLGALWMYQLHLSDWKEKITDVLPGAVVKSLVGAILIQLIKRLMAGKAKRAFEEN